MSLAKMESQLYLNFIHKALKDKVLRTNEYVKGDSDLFARQPTDTYVRYQMGISLKMPHVAFTELQVVDLDMDFITLRTKQGTILLNKAIVNQLIAAPHTFVHRYNGFWYWLE